MFTWARWNSPIDPPIGHALMPEDNIDWRARAGFFLNRRYVGVTWRRIVLRR